MQMEEIRSMAEQEEHTAPEKQQGGIITWIRGLVARLFSKNADEMFNERSDWE